GLGLHTIIEKRKKLPLLEFFPLAEQMLEGLSYAHHMRIIHREIKPSNIMFAQDKTLKIADFGIAKVAHDALAQITRETVSGTLVYMAPERLKGKLDNFQSDIYSVGIMLYEFLKGKPPFYTGAVEFQIIHSDPPPLTGVPDFLAKVIYKAIAKSPEDRWQSAEEIVLALDRRSLIPKPLPSEVNNERRKRNKEYQAESMADKQFPAIRKKKTAPWIAAGISLLLLSLVGAGILIKHKLNDSQKTVYDETGLKAEEIKKLLSAADVLIVKKRLIKPKGNNALELFRRVQELDPENFYARQKIAWIEEKFLDWAEKARITNDLKKSEEYLLKASAVNPDNLETKKKIFEISVLIAAARPEKTIAEINREKILKKITRKKEAKKKAARKKAEKERIRKRKQAEKAKQKALKAKRKSEAVKKGRKSLFYYSGMIFIPAGKFIMGSSEKQIKEYIRQFPATTDRPNWRKRMFEDEQKNQKALEVSLNPFWIDRLEVTNRQYQEFVKANSQWNKYNIPSRYCDENYLKHWDGDQYPIDKADHPVVFVSWYAAKAYARWKGKRLPTEAEWEKTARGEKGLIWPWGNQWNSANLNSHESGFQGTVPVGSFLQGASPYKVLDMAGNVWEWCNDWYGRDYYNSAPTQNPQGALKGRLKVLRGGSWGSYQKNTRSANRYQVPPTFCGYSIGFRCAKTDTSKVLAD
ncbi:MAG: SUMF1/EgtB/PvdO family nonheme iron enzyme, partial [bacterium]